MPTHVGIVMSRTFKFTAAALLLCPLTACASRGADGTMTAMPQPGPPPLFDLERMPFVAVGGAGATGEYAMDRIVWVAPWRDGFMVASDAGAEVRFFDGRGRHVRTLDQLGDGSNRLRSVRLLKELDDGRILLVDIAQRSLLISSPDGTSAASYPLGRKRSGGALANGSLVTTEGPFGLAGELAPGLTTTVGRVSLLQPATGISITLDSARSSTWYRSEGERYPLQVPWTTRLLHAAGADRIVTGWTGLPTVRVFDQTGELLHSIRWPQQRRPITNDEVDAFVARAPESSREHLRERIESGPEELYDQIYRMLQVDDHGNVWVQLEYRPGDRFQQWLKFDDRGDPAGYMQLPRRMRVWSVGEDRLLATWFEDGVPSVRLYDLTSAQ